MSSLVLVLLLAAMYIMRPACAWRRSSAAVADAAVADVEEGPGDVSWADALTFGVEMELHDSVKLALRVVEYDFFTGKYSEPCYGNTYWESAQLTDKRDGTPQLPLLRVSDDHENSGLCIFEVITGPLKLTPEYMKAVKVALQAFRGGVEAEHADIANKKWESMDCGQTIRKRSSLGSVFRRRSADPKRASGCLPVLYESRLEFPPSHRGVCVGQGCEEDEDSDASAANKAFIIRKLSASSGKGASRRVSGVSTADIVICTPCALAVEHWPDKAVDAKFWKHDLLNNCNLPSVCINSRHADTYPPNFGGWIDDEGKRIIKDERPTFALEDLKGSFATALKRNAANADQSIRSILSGFFPNDSSTYKHAALLNGLFFVPRSALRFMSDIEADYHVLGLDPINEEGLPYLQTNLDLPFVSLADPMFYDMFEDSKNMKAIFSHALRAATLYYRTRVDANARSASLTCAANMLIASFVSQITTAYAIRLVSDADVPINTGPFKNQFSFLPKASIAHVMREYWLHLRAAARKSAFRGSADKILKWSANGGQDALDAEQLYTMFVKSMSNDDDDGVVALVNAAMRGLSYFQKYWVVNNFERLAASAVLDTPPDYALPIYSLSPSGLSGALLGIVVEDRRQERTGKADMNFALMPASSPPSHDREIHDLVDSWVSLARRAHEYFGCGDRSSDDTDPLLESMVVDEGTAQDDNYYSGDDESMDGDMETA